LEWPPATYCDIFLTSLAAIPKANTDVVVTAEITQAGSLAAAHRFADMLQISTSKHCMAQHHCTACLENGSKKLSIMVRHTKEAPFTPTGVSETQIVF